MKRFSVVVLLVGGVVLSACVTPQQVDLIEREQRRLRNESTNVLGETAGVRNEIEAVRSSLADTRANVQQMQRELAALREKFDEVRYQVGRQLGQSSREGDQRIKDLESRIAKMDEELKSQGMLLKAREEELKLVRETLKGAQQARESAVAERSDVRGELPGEQVTAESDVVKKDYDAGWRLLEQKDYRGAIARFREFLKRHPKSDLADNAQYWIGESHYALREFDQAILEFDAVRRRYPNGDKVPAALLKQGFAFAELGDKVDARLILQELMERYPQSPEAAKARQKLKALES